MSDETKTISVARLRDFEGHPYSVKDDEAMEELAASVRSKGVIVPLLVRPVDDGYEIISGHRRKRACELAGVLEVRAIVHECDRDEATILMVDSNLQREEVSPTERGMAYRMKLEAIKHQGEREDLTCAQVGYKLQSGTKSVEKVAEEAGTSRTQIQRYIRLTELVPELQEMVDEKKMALTPAVEISYLKPEEQQMLVETIASEQCMPSLSQAQRMKQLSQEGGLNEDTVLEIMCEVKKPDLAGDITLRQTTLQKYFPKYYTPRQMEDVIVKLLENWHRQRKRSQSMER